jgi:hypothetical protein
MESGEKWRRDAATTAAGDPSARSGGTGGATKSITWKRIG